MASPVEQGLNGQAKAHEPKVVRRRVVTVVEELLEDNTLSYRVQGVEHSVVTDSGLMVAGAAQPKGLNAATAIGLITNFFQQFAVRAAQMQDATQIHHG